MSGNAVKSQKCETLQPLVILLHLASVNDIVTKVRLLQPATKMDVPNFRQYIK